MINCIILDGAYTSLGSICNNVVYFKINWIFLDGVYTSLRSMCNKMVHSMINCIFLLGLILHYDQYAITSCIS